MSPRPAAAVRIEIPCGSPAGLACECAAYDCTPSCHSRALLRPPKLQRLRHARPNLQRLCHSTFACGAFPIVVRSPRRSARVDRLLASARLHRLHASFVFPVPLRFLTRSVNRLHVICVGLCQFVVRAVASSYRFAAASNSGVRECHARFLCRAPVQDANSSTPFSRCLASHKTAQHSVAFGLSPKSSCCCKTSSVRSLVFLHKNPKLTARGKRVLRIELDRFFIAASESVNRSAAGRNSQERFAPSKLRVHFRLIKLAPRRPNLAALLHHGQIHMVWLRRASSPPLGSFLRCAF